MIRSIRTKILVLTLPVVFITVILSVYLSANLGKRIIHSQVQTRIEAQQVEKGLEIESKLQYAKYHATDIAVYVANSYQKTELKEYEDILENIIKNDSFVLGAGIWFEPYIYDSTQKYIGPYVYKNGEKIERTYAYSNEAYDYYSKEYYYRVKDSGTMILTNPYYDETSGFYMLTCSVPIIDERGSFLGCVTIDIHLSEMNKLVSSFITKDVEDVFILDSDGIYLASLDNGKVENKNQIMKDPNSSLQKAGKIIMENESGNLSYIEDNKRYHLFYSTISSLNWKIVFKIAESSILSPIHKLIYLLVSIGILTLLIISGNIIFFTYKNIVYPINLLIDEFELIGNQEYQYEISEVLFGYKDEIGVLAKALDQMKKNLKLSQEEITATLEEYIAASDELEDQNTLLLNRENELRESVRYNQSIIKVIPDLLFLISREGIFLDCQGDDEWLLYSNKSEYIGKSVYDVMPKDIADLGMEKIKAVFEEGTLQYCEYDIEINRKREYFELRITQCFEDNVMAIVRKNTEQYTHLRQIEHLSYHDQLTNLYNRRYFDEELKNIDDINLFPIGIIFADLNGLKLVNDSFGHEKGDQLLKKCTQVLVNTCSKTNRIARIGGDEFAILLPRTTQEEVETLVHQISENCEKESVNNLPLSVSLGWGIKSNDTQKLRDILKISEDMMYKKKMYEAPSRRGKTIEVIISSLHEKNPREEQHSHRVAELCTLLASALQLSNQQKKIIRSAGLLHDIGKIGISEVLLNKPGKLTDEEYKTICKHPEIGYRILQSANDMGEIAEIILAHHESYDGSGYPRGLKGEEIPYISRMVTIADAFDAMTSVRSYRLPFTEEDAAKEIIAKAGIQFDPDLAKCFVEEVLQYKF